MYRVVGKVGIDTDVGDALQIGVDALNDDTLMEGVVDDLVDMGKNAVKKAGKAAATASLAAAPGLVGCAGHTPSVDLDTNKHTIEYIADEYNINPTEINDGNTIIPHLITTVTQKIVQQNTQMNDNNTLGEYIPIDKMPAVEDAKEIYKLLKDGEIKVSNYTLDPTRHTQDDAQKAAADRFAGGLRNMFHKQLGVDGEAFLKELN
jgi:hypothetical protein